MCPASRHAAAAPRIDIQREAPSADCALLLVPAYLAWRGRRSVCGWLPTMLLLPLFLAIIIGLASAGRPDVAAVFVSAALGDDRNDGLGRLTPVRSLSHAVSLARHRSRRIFLDADVHGTFHFLNQTLALGPADCGLQIRTDPADAQHGRQAVLSGGVPVRFSPTVAVAPGGRRIFSAPVPAMSAITQLFIGGKRAVRARTPNLPPPRGASAARAAARGFADEDTLHWLRPLRACNATGPDKLPACPPVNALGFVFNGTDLNASWHRLASAEILLFQAWSATWHRVGTVFGHNQTVLFAKPASYMGGAVGQFSSQGGRRYVIENVREALDASDEFYHDPEMAELLYIPENVAEFSGTNNMTGYVPILNTLITIAGSTHYSLVQNITIDGITLAHSTDGGEARFQNSASSAAVQIGPAAAGIRITNVALQHGGATGLLATGANMTDIVVSGCSVTDFGADGIAFEGQDASHINISDNRVSEIGVVFLVQPSGIRLGYSRSMNGLALNEAPRDVVVEHNEVSQTPYASMGISWSFPGMPTPSPTIFRVRHNHLHHFGLGVLSDFGAIYMGSGSNVCFQTKPDTCSLPILIHHNLIHDGISYNYGANGIYADEQTPSVNASGNIVFNVGGSGIYFHCGANNNAENSILVNDSMQGSHCLDPGGDPNSCSSAIKSCNPGGNPTWPNISHGFRFRHNIVTLTPQGHLTEPPPEESDYRSVHFDNNCYHRSGTPNGTRHGSELLFGNHSSWAQWRASGQDLHSVIADPQLEWGAVPGLDPGLLLPQPAASSPVWRLGFKPIALNGFGPR